MGVNTVGTAQFERMSESVAAVRRMIAALLDHVRPHRRSEVVLVASELGSNVVGYAWTRYVVALTISDVARIEVTDHGPGTPRLMRPG